MALVNNLTLALKILHFELGSWTKLLNKYDYSVTLEDLKSL